MAITLGMVTFDCTDPAALARWWAAQLGGDVNEVAQGAFVMVAWPGGPPLGFQKVADPTPGKNRAHLDFVDAEVARLTAGGATEVARNSYGNDFWVVLTDPDGNEFCVCGQ